MTDDSPIPTIHFDGTQLPGDVRLAAWSRLTPGYDVAPAEGLRAEDAELHSRGWLFDDFVVTASQVSPLRISRTPAHILADRRDTYSFILLKRGGWRGSMDNGDVQVGSGQVAIMDFASTWEVEGTAQDNIMLVLPRSRVAALAPEAPPLHGRTLDGAGGRMLAEHMLALVRHLPEMKRRDAQVVSSATMSLVSIALGALSPEPEEEKTSDRQRQQIFSRIRALVEDNLTSPKLSVDLLCREGATTRSTLYRAMEASGGIAAYIQRRRLEAAHALISDTSDHVSMTEIADRFCFSSQAHFSTAFRRLYGYAPRQARLHAPRSEDVGALFEDWRQVIDAS